MIDIEYYTSEATTLLNSLIGIPSLSREEEAAADFLQNYIEETGIMTGRSGNNIWCISPMFDLNKPTILLKFPHRYRKTGKRMAETSFHSESRKRKDLRFGK